MAGDHGGASKAVPSFQQLILSLQGFWAARDCVLLQPYDMEMGAGAGCAAVSPSEHPILSL